MTRTVRIWDLPTRLFHWVLVVCILGLLTTGSLGGNAMVWHFRFGYSVLSLLLFRLVWGFIGGHWSRFTTFLYSPGSVVSYFRGRRLPEHSVGHSPAGAGSVFAMLFLLVVQVGSGLFSDDDIAFAGPLSQFASSTTIHLATWYHGNIGRWILIAMITLHVAAILFYLRKKKNNVLKPMLHGDKELAIAVQPSRDDGKSRATAAVVFALCVAGVAWAVERLT